MTAIATVLITLVTTFIEVLSQKPPRSFTITEVWAYPID